MTMSNAPVVLCILDGWGYREDSVDNAIKLATLPNYTKFWEQGNRCWLKTSGLAVGLPEGQMGNSEVGHMNIGSGRVVLQDLPRIDDSISNNMLVHEEEIQAHIHALKTSGGTCHLMGLLSPGGVHSHQDHIVALAKIFSDAGIPVAIHAFLDGRDTPPKSASDFLSRFEEAIHALEEISIATMTGRYYAMDRDERWDRVETAYRAIAEAKGQATAASASEALEKAYAEEKFDEFVPATVIGDYEGMKPGDGLLMANFRADRAREILACFVDPDFNGFPLDSIASTLVSRTGMVEYSSHLAQFMTTVFPSPEINNSLGEIISNAGMKQLRIAETEKYAHVTFFFNGGKEDIFNGEDRILIPSPDVATYDLQPEMSAPELTDNLVKAISSGKYSTIIVNYANPDMVGHTGVLSAAIAAVEAVDKSLGRVEEAVTAAGGQLLITADHGNVELMKNQETGAPHTAHTSFDVPLVALGLDRNLQDGALSDIAPTILELVGIEQPKDMTGTSLLA
ncbi:2,3-bisphosphoglycerate-independent phosphoglycerate mutase [Temperatibacter marinus]|uniref:2,3-bisphosphoglycerate-independent phosphoglycerate mutase n=1 Tax=Temperatibacter marinus TaxID=1456591 RepID=A0AA52EE71_9PROT|nr:2,3-bisphosphoglycerate-independent phosphoglycerate mutase [Temperatibacter marinus]WND01443.1 2,3-bisphosphoglycerate-independent phosphoglycerate mutase [Temperatibacter marinus]